MRASPESVGAKSVPVEDGFKLSCLNRTVEPCFDGSQIGGKYARAQRLWHSADALLQQSHQHSRLAFGLAPGLADGNAFFEILLTETLHDLLRVVGHQTLQCCAQRLSA